MPADGAPHSTPDCQPTPTPDLDGVGIHTPDTPSVDGTEPYPEVGRADFPAIERRMLARWQAEGTFAESVAARPADRDWVFYDGPPFANGLPHHGHLLTGFVKDVVPRYQTMRGRRVDRRFGWDCHGLPAEMETERELGVSGRAGVTGYGIANFNDHCRQSVLRYTQQWRQTVTRQARWVDFDNDYKTMDLPYMESVIWAFAQLYRKGLIYEAYRVMPYSWGAETPLSNFEIRLDDATRPRQDPAITVAFDLLPQPGDPGPMRMLAWTTTPWTLPSNLALAVGPDIEYAVLELDGVHHVLAEATVEAYGAQLSEARRVATITGRQLVDRSYVPLFDYFAHRAGSGTSSGAFRVLPADFVDTSEGTGIVHMAPGFGLEDQEVCEANGIPIGDAVPVDDSGRFTSAISDWPGMNVFDTNSEIIRCLKTEGRIVRHDTYEHNYPYCWRTDTPLIYKAINSWYVQVTAIKERLCQLNQEINWIPDHVRDGRFGMWLAGARDWSISRNRFWGSPIPVWRSDDPAYPRTDVYGSLDEIQRDFGVRPSDLHRPYIDKLVRPNPDDPTGRSTMRRVPEVLDCWFESGSMPFAQVHYPFENAEWFDRCFPGDFIVEYINQTRGWFYTLHVLAGALFGPTSLLECDLSRDTAGRGRQQAVQETAQLHRADRDIRSPRGRRYALVSDRRQRDARRRSQGERRRHRRGGAAGAAARVERLLVLRAVRQRRGLPGEPPLRQPRCARPLRAGQGEGDVRGGGRTDGRLRPCPALPRKSPDSLMR